MLALRWNKSKGKKTVFPSPQLRSSDTNVNIRFDVICVRKKNLNTLIPNYDDCDKCGCEAERSDWEWGEGKTDKKRREARFDRKWIRKTKTNTKIWMMKCWMHNNNRVTNRWKRMKVPSNTTITTTTSYRNSNNDDDGDNTNIPWNRKAHVM